ncbi:MAG: hypothetical protein JXA43_01480 [Candidatus Diapherotrites archaeon]|nr:hypothetical protein [Candidatus Diapherotrites archaeon]
MLGTKLPICEQDAKLGALCKDCSLRLQNGQISDLDITISRIFSSVEDKFNLEEASFTKAIDMDTFIIIATDGNVGQLVGKKGRLVKYLSEKLGKLVRIVEVNEDINKAILDLMGQVSVVGINKVYKKEGHIEYAVMIAKDKNNKWLAPKEKMEDAIAQITGQSIKINLIGD